MARVLFNPLWLRLRRGVCGVGMRVEARMLCHLTRRICSNGAPQARSELCGAPRKRTNAGLPRSVAQGSQTVGRLSFGYFSLAKQRKVPRPPGRDPASRPQQSQNHSRNYQNNSYQRLPNKRQKPISPINRRLPLRPRLEPLVHPVVLPRHGENGGLQLSVHARGIGFHVLGGEIRLGGGELGDVARGRHARVHAQHLGPPQPGKAR